MSATADTEIVFAGPAALAERVRSREIHPRELVETCLRRLELLDPQLNAFRVTMAEEALAEAERAADSDGPLAGVPFAVKDELPVAGQVATRGSRSYGAPSATDAEVVRRVRAAGAIPIGITNVPELMIFPWTATEANGVTRNPWDPSRTPGGSSGGSAAAVAAGIVPWATGSDGGGSIRIPSAACGLVGMKPTRGSVPSAPRGEGWLGLSVYGALARTVRDSALVLDVMQDAGGALAGAAAREPERLRIAISTKVPPGVIARLDSDQREAWERTAKVLEGLGHHVEEHNPSYGLVQVEFVQLWLRGIYEESLEVPDRSKLEPLTRQMAWAGEHLVPERRKRALLERRARTSARILALWDTFDVLLTPALARTAIEAEGGFGRPAPLAIDKAARFTPYTPEFNFTGQPAIAVPAGIGRDGLPLSVQLVGRIGAEAALLSLAAQLELAAPWADRRPPIS